MQSKIIDNDRRQLGETLNSLSKDYKHLSIATGYWDLRGMQIIFHNIKRYKHIRLLIGQTPLIPPYVKKVQSNELESDFPKKDINLDLAQLPLENSYRQLVKEIKSLIKAGNLKVRIYRRSFLHAKCYIFGNHDCQQAIGIIGSSNFTHNGLTTNAELNALENDHRVVRYRPQDETDEHGHLSWFDKMWNDEKTEVWDENFTDILSNSPVGDLTYSPYEMYIKTLWELYEDEVLEEDQLNRDIVDPLYGFQERNAQLLIKKLDKHGLAMLADSVGLGKTITAGAVLKHYKNKGAKRIYIIAPAGLCEQWKIDLADKHKLFGLDILSMQNLNEIEKAQSIDKYADVDLFIIDEAHNLRSDTSKRHQKLLEWFEKNDKSKILLLTATPINNCLMDLSNQIRLAAKGRLKSFAITYPGATRNEQLDFFEALERLDAERKRAEKKQQQPDFDKISNVMSQGLKQFLVRTTRNGVKQFGEKNSQHFPEGHIKPQSYGFGSVLDQEIKKFLTGKNHIFGNQDPTCFDLDSLLSKTQRVQHPIDILPTIKLDKQIEASVFINIFQAMQMLGFAIYRPMIYRKNIYSKTQEEIKQMKLSSEDSFNLSRQMSIHNMLRVLFLKRFESSAYSFQQSLKTYLAKLKRFSNNLDKGRINEIQDDSSIINEFGDDLEVDVNGVESIIELAIEKDLYHLDYLKRDIQRDIDIVNVLMEACDKIINKDGKLLAFAKLFNNLVVRPPVGKKILVFSYYANTIKYLKQKLPKLIQGVDFENKVAFISGKSKSQVKKIADRFSPKSKGYNLHDSETEIDYLFSTDVLSEGQNLQDCGILINFDLHWNPVRMIQRNGRINRLGSEHKDIYVYNFHPETNLEKYLNLVRKLEQKIENIKYAIGTDQSVLGEESRPVEYADLYREDSADETYAYFEKDDKQFLIMDEYIQDLHQFLDTAEEELKHRIKSIPFGKWGYMPASSKSQPAIISLAYSEIKIPETGRYFKNHLFTQITPKDNVEITIMKPLEALRCLRTGKDDNKKRIDQIQFDRPKIREYVLQRTQAEKEESKGFELKPRHYKVLNQLTKIDNTINISSKLEYIDTKQDMKMVGKLFEQAYQCIKEDKTLSPNVVQGFRDLEKKLSQSDNRYKAEIINVQEVLFYVRQSF